MNLCRLKDYNERFKIPQQLNRYSNLVNDELLAQPYQIKEQISPLVNSKNINIFSNPEKLVKFKQTNESSFLKLEKLAHLFVSIEKLLIIKYCKYKFLF